MGQLCEAPLYKGKSVRLRKDSTGSIARAESSEPDHLSPGPTSRHADEGCKHTKLGDSIRTTAGI